MEAGSQGAAMRRVDGVMFEKSGERAVLLDVMGTTLFTLSPVGSLIWHALDGQRGSRELAHALVDEFDGSVGIDQLGADIEEFVRQLEEEGLVERPEVS